MTTLTADLESLWHDYNAPITGYIVNNIRDKEAVEDLVSNVFMRACVAIKNGNGYTESASGWLFQIARSVMWDYHRAKRRITFVNIEDCAERADPYPQPDEAVEQILQSEYVRREVARLPEEQATVTTWRLCGYEFDEIAEGMGKSPGAAKQLHTRAYANLRKQIGEAA